MFIDKLLKVAKPDTAATLVVPLKVPELGFVPIVKLTVFVALVTRLLLLSSMRTVTEGEILLPAVVFVGCCKRDNLDGEPGLMLNAELVTDEMFVAVNCRVYAAPVLLIFKLLKVAMPPTAFWVKVPLRVPAGLPALFKIATVTAFVALVTKLLLRSRISTVIAGLMLDPAIVFVGC